MIGIQCGMFSHTETSRNVREKTKAGEVEKEQTDRDNYKTPARLLLLAQQD